MPIYPSVFQCFKNLKPNSAAGSEFQEGYIVVLTFALYIVCSLLDPGCVYVYMCI